MALLFMEGFETYSETLTTDTQTELIKIWTGGITGTDGTLLVAGRTGGYGIQFTGDLSGTTVGTLIGPSFGSIASGVCGFGVKTPAVVTSSNVMFALRDNATNQLQLKMVSGFLQLSNGDGTVLGTSAVALSVSTWYYIEMSFTINDTTGACIVKQDGIPVITVTSVDTKNSANASCDRIVLGSLAYDPANCPSYDDIYVCSTAGSFNNTFLGNFRTRLVKPDSAGDLAEWTPNTGTNWGAVDDVPNDADTTYVSTSVNNNIDLHNQNSPTHGGTSVVGLQTRVVARKETADAAIAIVHKPGGGTAQVGSTINLTSATYGVTTVLHGLNPETGVLWLQAEIDGLQVGVKKIA